MQNIQIKNDIHKPLILNSLSLEFKPISSHFEESNGGISLAPNMIGFPN